MFELDVARAREVSNCLLTAYQTDGIFGTQTMPEDLCPADVPVGSEAHLRFITFTVAIDYQRDADQLWDAARNTYADPATRYLFDPASVAEQGVATIRRDLQRYRLSRKHDRDTNVWHRIARTLSEEFTGRVEALLLRSRTDALELLDLIRSSRFRSGFPNLKGEKIGPLWVRMLYDNCEVRLKRIEEVRLPVDVHTAQATLQLGCIRSTTTTGSMADLRSAVQHVWRDACLDASDDRYPLRLDEPLWLLSRRGCRHTSLWPCEYAERCPVVGYCQPLQLRLQISESRSPLDQDWQILVHQPLNS